MIAILYDFIQLLAFLAYLPKLVVSWVLQKDRSLFDYLGFSLPKAKPSQGLCFLFYAVSVGEVKAVSSLFSIMKETYPTVSFYIACRTTTGLEEAKRTLLGADSYFLLPFDFSWLSKKLMKRLSPDVLFIVEGDLWYNFLKAARKKRSLVCLISGKISLRSYRRFSYFSYFSKKLFSLFTLICAQNSVFAERFVDLGADASSVLVTGNIKLGIRKELLQEEGRVSLRKKLGMEASDFVVVIGSTHDPEEEEIIKALRPLWEQFPHMKCIIVPRHQNRFSEVKQILVNTKIPFVVFSNLNQKTGKEKILIIDEMGLLSDLYQIADVAIVGGSFDKSLQGHNIVEPIWMGAPVLFGPYMESQTDLVDLVLSFGAGVQLELIELPVILESYMKDPAILLSLRQKGQDLLSGVEGATLRTWAPIKRHIESIR
ncbi:MAG: glycosyltransferase N-terminal domain-containing protein [Chlamydiota bacterium]